MNIEVATPREKLQGLFDNAFLTGDSGHLRKSYYTLRQLDFNRQASDIISPVDISSLAENLSIACDILTDGTGISFVFCGNHTAPAMGNLWAITKSLLNLFSNAYLYGTGNLVTVKTIEKQNYIQLEVKNEGAFNSADFSKGLNLVNKACRQGGGRFFIDTDLFTTRAVMILKKSKIDSKTSIPDFCQLLGDRLSPVYVEMFGMG